jgi:drug/metabolite transporter (DMT)-like permease
MKDRGNLISVGIVLLIVGAKLYDPRNPTSIEYWLGAIFMAFGATFIARYLEKRRKGK